MEVFGGPRARTWDDRGRAAAKSVTLGGGMVN